jgi:hypothetical protein
MQFHPDIDDDEIDNDSEWEDGAGNSEASDHSDDCNEVV